jgi:hypothetical protein
MRCDGKLTDQEFKKVKMLAYKAINVNNEKLAKSFVNRMDFMKRTLDIEPYKRNVLSELIFYVKVLSGQVREKGHWMGVVSQSIFKLKLYAVDMGGK